MPVSTAIPSASADSARYPARIWVAFVLAMIVALPIYVLFPTDRFSLLARLISWVGLCLSLLPAVVMVTRPGHRMNGVAATGLVIALFYHLAVFHERNLKLRWGEARISDTSVELGLLLATLATPALWLGWYLAGVARIGKVLPRPALDVPPRLIFNVGTFICLWSLLINALWLRGDLSIQQPVVSVIAVFSPTELGFAMVLVPWLRGHGGPKDKLTVFGLLFLAGVLSLMSGMILVVLRPLIVYLLGWLFIRRRARLFSVVVLLGVVLVMQPVKAEFRARVWDKATEMGLTERATLYVELLARHWLGGDTTDSADATQSVETAAARTGAVLSLSHYIELTPSTVPHQYGATYRYFLYAPIPRVFDPQKPTAQFADIWAAVMYGYTTEGGTAHVMVGLSQIAESYINFGFLGSLFMLMFIGVLYRGMDEVLGREEAGLGGLAIYLYYVESVMIGSEGSLAQFWGGALQGLIFYGVCMAVLGSRMMRRPQVGPATN